MRHSRRYCRCGAHGHLAVLLHDQVVQALVERLAAKVHRDLGVLDQPAPPVVQARDGWHVVLVTLGPRQVVTRCGANLTPLSWSVQGDGRARTWCAQCLTGEPA